MDGKTKQHLDRIAAGNAFEDGQIGALSGTVLGSLIGTLAHDEAIRSELRRAIQLKEKLQLRSNDCGKVSPDAVAGMERVLRQNPGFWRLWNVVDRKSKAMMGAILGAIGFGAIAAVVGYIRGRKAVDEVKREIDVLEARKETLEQSMSALQPQSEREGVFVRAVEADRKRQQNTQRTPG